MKKYLSLFVAIVVSFPVFGEKQVTIKAGTIVPLVSVQRTKAADVAEGQTVDFKVARDVMIDGICAIW